MKRISEKLQSRYSVLVEQYALTQGAFLYWQLVKKNTQNLGSIFDPLPSQTISNIHCITNPQEPVVGYFSACSIRQTRIFIDREDLPLLIHATGYESCELHSLLVNAIPYFRGQELIVNKAFKGITFLGYTLASPFCADCRVRNGTTVKPDFW